MKCPTWLDTEAKKFWKKNSLHCIENGSLTEATMDSFCMTCRVWSILQATDPHEDSKASMKFTGILKFWIALAKPFGLLGSKAPAGKPKKNIVELMKDAIAEQADEDESDSD